MTPTLNSSVANNPNAAVMDLLSRLTQDQFWGTVTLKFERGEVVNIRKEENIKPSELSGYPRSISSAPKR
jgi:hypothetical protein